MSAPTRVGNILCATNGGTRWREGGKRTRVLERVERYIFGKLTLHPDAQRTRLHVQQTDMLSRVESPRGFLKMWNLQRLSNLRKKSKEEESNKMKIKTRSHKTKRLVLVATHLFLHVQALAVIYPSV